MPKLGLQISPLGLDVEAALVVRHDDSVDSDFKFIYAETPKLIFGGIKGFETLNGTVFPGMRMKVRDLANGKVILAAEDVYAQNHEGFNMPNLQLVSHFTTAYPIQSEGLYQLDVEIWDKRGLGRLEAQLVFQVLKDPLIEWQAQGGISAKEIYFYSQERNLVVLNGRMQRFEHFYLFLGDLQGFETDEQGLAHAGVGVYLEDRNGRVVLDIPDLIGDQAFAPEELSNRLSPCICLEGPDIQSPVTWQVKVWDKLAQGEIYLRCVLELD